MFIVSPGMISMPKISSDDSCRGTRSVLDHPRMSPSLLPDTDHQFCILSSPSQFCLHSACYSVSWTLVVALSLV